MVEIVESTARGGKEEGKWYRTRETREEHTNWFTENGDTKL